MATAQASAVSTPSQKAKITLYWLNRSRAQRIVWMLEEAKLEYDVKVFKRDENLLAPRELREVHPLGKSPLLGVATAASEKKPIIIAESGNIAEYVVDNFATWLRPRKYRTGLEGQVGGETESWLRYQHLMQYAEGTLIGILLFAQIFRGIPEKTPFFLRPIARSISGAVESKFIYPQLKLNFDFLESQLASSPDGGQFFCGKDLTAADILLSFPLGAARSGGVALTEGKYPKLYAYVDLLEAQDGYKRSVDRINELEGHYEPYF